MPPKFDLSESQNENNNSCKENVSSLTYSAFASGSGGGESGSRSNTVSLPYSKQVNYVPVSNSDCELLSSLNDEVDNAASGEPPVVLTEEETGGNDKASASKWSFAGVVNSAFHFSEDKKRQTRVRDSSGIELDQMDHQGKESDGLSVTSVNSYYMNRDFRYYFQHPYFRLAVAYLVTFCNFIIYAEDPVAHSDKECFIPVVGNCFSFVCTKYPSNGWAVLKVFLWLIAILIGLIVGKLFVHMVVFNKLFRLKMFADSQGSWMVMFFTTIVFLFVFSWLYNAFLLIGGSATTAFTISDLMGIKNSWFLKAAATGTWCGDFFTAWMVTDIMLQETLLYPDWAQGVRKWWNRGYHRIVLFWVIVVTTSFVVILVIATDWIKWDRLNRDFVASNEISRAFLASFILVMDLLIVMQDWDFPHFINNFDIKLPGLNTAKITFHIPNYFKRETWVVHITGKWFNYGIIFIVMILDLNMWKNQIFYSPYEYGQYAGPEGKIYTVTDEESLENHNETFLTYDWRLNNSNPATNESYLDGDMVMNSRYYDFPLSIKGIAFVPSLAAFVCFGLMIWFFGRWHPSSRDPYSGRLKKKHKPILVTRWAKLRAFFYAKNKFDARARSFRRRNNSSRESSMRTIRRGVDKVIKGQSNGQGQTVTGNGTELTTVQVVEEKTCTQVGQGHPDRKVGQGGLVLKEGQSHPEREVGRGEMVLKEGGQCKVPIGEGQGRSQSVKVDQSKPKLEANIEGIDVVGGSSACEKDIEVEEKETLHGSEVIQGHLGSQSEKSVTNLGKIRSEKSGAEIMEDRSNNKI